MPFPEADIWEAIIAFTDGLGGLQYCVQRVKPDHTVPLRETFSPKAVYSLCGVACCVSI